MTLREHQRRAADEVNPETLCRNWTRGCNGVSDGPDSRGELTLCDECATTSPPPNRATADTNKTWTVHSTGLRRGRIATRASTFASYNDACAWAIRQGDKGFDVRIEEDKPWSEYAC